VAELLVLSAVNCAYCGLCNFPKKSAATTQLRCVCAVHVCSAWVNISAHPVREPGRLINLQIGRWQQQQQQQKQQQQQQQHDWTQLLVL
jgi:hypothetical protein